MAYDDALDIIDEVKESVFNWRFFFKQCHVNNEDIERFFLYL